MADFFTELKRRHIYRVAAAYAVVAWLLLQIVNNVAPVLDLPPWVARALLLLLALGFPIALLFSWMRELAPAETAPKQLIGRTDWALIGAAVVVVAIFSYQQLASDRSVTEQAGVDAARLAADSPATAVSIAVLPFSNVSADPEQEFFSDGMTDEISSALAKIPDLRVVARTSAFQFKGQNAGIAQISSALNATHLVEGTVRKAGDRVRITVQLVQASDGLQMWSQNYDRNVIDIFAIQEEIARTVARSLGMQLGLAAGENLVSGRLADPALYEEFLRARAQLRAREGTGYMPDAVPVLERFLARAPGYAPAWATLANGYGVAAVAAPRLGEFRLGVEYLDKAEAAARKAIALDPEFVGGHAELARALARRGKWAEAEELYKQAFAIDPSDPELLQSYGNTLFVVGRLKDSLGVRERLLALEPLVPVYNQATARIKLANGRVDEAIAMMEPDPARNVNRNINLAEAYAEKGRFADAADTLLRIGDVIGRSSVENAARLLRAAPTTTDAPESLPKLESELGFIYPYIGAPERVLEYPELGVKEGNLAVVQMVWHRVAAPVRKTERFKTLMRNAGLVEYWRVRGWPDLCRPTGPDDFACD